MTITVSLFGPLREAAERPSIQLTWRTHMTAAHVKTEALAKLQLKSGRAPSTVFLASEQAILPDEVEIADGDTVYLMPPFGGG